MKLYTSKENKLFQERWAQANLFAVKGDVFVNSPGDRARLLQSATAFAANPLGQVWNGLVSVEPYGDECMDTAFAYLCSGNDAFAAAVVAHINAQVSVAESNIGVYWRSLPKDPDDVWAVSYENGFMESKWLLRLLQAYKICQDHFSSAEQFKVEAYFIAAAQYFFDRFQDSQLTGDFPAYLEGDYSLVKQYAWPSDFGPSIHWAGGEDLYRIFPMATMDWVDEDYYPDGRVEGVSTVSGLAQLFIYAYTHRNGDGALGNRIPRSAGHFHNRNWSKTALIHAVGRLIGVDRFVKHGVNFYKLSFKYGIFPDGTTYDYIRNEDYTPRVPCQGLNYSCMIWADMLRVCELEMKAGVDLFSYSTIDGAHGTQCPPGHPGKSILTCLYHYYQLCSGELIMYASKQQDSHRLRHYSTLSNGSQRFAVWGQQLAAMARRFRSDLEWLQLWESNSYPGAVPLPNALDSAGPIGNPWSGPSATTPAVMFQYALTAGMDLDDEGEDPFSAVIEYFRDLAGKHKQIAGSFVHGDSRRFQAESREKLRYPCLWLETPNQDLKNNGSGSHFLHSSAAFLILWNTDQTDAAAQDKIWSKTNKIAFEFIARINKDAKERRQSLIGSEFFNIDPVDTLFVDNDYGWRVEFQLKQPQDICDKAEAWNS